MVLNSDLHHANDEFKMLEKTDVSHTISKKRCNSYAMTPSVSYSSNRSVTWGEDVIYDLYDNIESQRDYYDDPHEIEGRDLSNVVHKIYVKERRTDLSSDLSTDESTAASTVATSSLSSYSESESFVRRMEQAEGVEDKEMSPSSSLHASHSSVRKSRHEKKHRQIALSGRVEESSMPVGIRRHQSSLKRTEHTFIRKPRQNHFDFLYNLSKEMQKDGKRRREAIFYASIQRNAVARKEDFGKIPLEKAADMYIRGIRSIHEKEVKLDRERKMIAENELNKHNFKLARGAFACCPDPSRLRSEDFYCFHTESNNSNLLPRDRAGLAVNCSHVGDEAIYRINGGANSVLNCAFHREQKIPLSRACDMYDRSIKRSRAKHERIGAEQNEAEEHRRSGSKRIPLSRASDLYVKSIEFIEEKERKIAEKAARLREEQESKWRPLSSKDASSIYDRYSKEKRSSGLLGTHHWKKDFRKKMSGMKQGDTYEDKISCDPRRAQLEKWRKPKLAAKAEDRKRCEDFNNYCFFEKHNRMIMKE